MTIDESFDHQLVCGTVESIAKEAQRDHVMYPQYEGHWETDDWFLVRFTSEVETKLGGAFFPGDVTIAHLDEDHREGVLTAYSRRNHIDTFIFDHDCEAI
jgi:hypothetical protein